MAIDDDLVLPWVTQAEILAGALRYPDDERTLAKVNDFLGDFEVILPDLATVQHYAKLDAALASKGLRIPTNDLWIAALAVQHKAIVVSSDNHFLRLTDVAVENWLA